MARLVSRDCVIDIELRDEVVTLGRSSTNAICLRAPGISKVHAKIEPCDEGFRICDLDSTNGTLVNGEAVKKALLRDRDFVKLGAEELLFLADGKDLSDTQVLTIFEKRDKPAEEESPSAEDDEFLWGPDQTVADTKAPPPAPLEAERPAPRSVEVWRAPWKRREPFEERVEWIRREPAEEDVERKRREPAEEEQEVEMQIAEGEIALIGELEREKDMRGEFLRQERALRFRRSVTTAMWLIASALLHIQLVLLLGNIGLWINEKTPRRIVVMETAMVDAIEREQLAPLPKTTEVPPPVPTAEPEEAAAEKMALAAKDMTTLPAPDVKVAEVEGLLGPPRAPTVAALPPSVVAKGPGTGAALALITAEKPETQADILDDLVRQMVEALRKDFLHVILLFDESRSIDKDRQWMKDRLEAVIKELFIHLKPREMERLRWSVASFGRMPHLQQSPTQKLEDVRLGITKVPNDDSGQENPCAALQFCMRNLRTRFATFMILFSDETGDDTANDRILEETIAEVKRLKMRVFVFGREASFSAAKIRIPYRDPKSGQMVDVETDAGPESPMLEFFTHDELFYRTEAMPSGFGIYGLARIANQSGGSYYLLNPGAKSYDTARLEQYAPDLCSRKDYGDRNARVAARQKILGIVREWDKVRPEARVQTRNVMTMVPAYVNKVDKAMSFCTEGITALKNLQFKKDLELRNVRWEAHRDLTLAELYKFKLLLGEYKNAFKSLQGIPLSRNGGPLVGYMARLQPGGPVGSTAAAKKLHESAIAQFKLVMEKHAKTPWAAIAENEMRTIGSITIFPLYEEPPSNEPERPRQPPPEPPKV